MILEENLFKETFALSEWCDKNMWHMWNIINSETILWAFGSMLVTNVSIEMWSRMFLSFCAVNEIFYRGEIAWMLFCWRWKLIDSEIARRAWGNEKENNTKTTCRIFFFFRPMKTLWYSLFVYVSTSPAKIVLIKSCSVHSRNVEEYERRLFTLVFHWKLSERMN